MPHGELFIKTSKTDGFVDAYDRYGLSLSDGALDKLMTPAPNKQPASNKNAQKPGVGYIGKTVNVRDERTTSLDMHIVAPDKIQYARQWKLFCDEVLNLPSGDGEYITMKTAYYPSVFFRFIYQDCEQFRHFIQGMAIFTLGLIEPHPEQRGENIVTDDNT